eukprot:3642961-Rhodomonas_salina.1
MREGRRRVCRQRGWRGPVHVLKGFLDEEARVHEFLSTLRPHLPAPQPLLTSTLRIPHPDDAPQQGGRLPLAP